MQSSCSVSDGVAAILLEYFRENISCFVVLNVLVYMLYFCWYLKLGMIVDVDNRNVFPVKRKATANEFIWALLICTRD